MCAFWTLSNLLVFDGSGERSKVGSKERRTPASPLPPPRATTPLPTRKHTHTQTHTHTQGPAKLMPGSAHAEETHAYFMPPSHTLMRSVGSTQTET